MNLNMWISHAKQATEKHKTIEIKHKKANRDTQDSQYRNARN
jgi:hypothetical protein